MLLPLFYISSFSLFLRRRAHIGGEEFVRRALIIIVIISIIFIIIVIIILIIGFFGFPK